MPRRVIEGSPGNLVVVRPADLPTNADYSYFRYVRLTGTWGPTRSLRYVDLVEGECDADLRQADILGFATRDTDCEGVRVTPRQADTCVYEMIRGHTLGRVKAKMLDLGASQAAVDTTTSFASMKALGDDTRRSWRRIISYLMRETGLGAAAIRQVVAAGLIDMPRMDRTALRDDEEDATSVEVIVKMWASPDLHWNVSGWGQPMLDALQRNDRWQLARAAEAASPFPLVALCRALWPVFDCIATPRRLFTNPDEFGFEFNATTARDRIAEVSADRAGMLFGPRRC